MKTLLTGLFHTIYMVGSYKGKTTVASPIAHAT